MPAEYQSSGSTGPTDEEARANTLRRARFRARFNWIFFVAAIALLIPPLLVLKIGDSLIHEGLTISKGAVLVGPTAKPPDCSAPSSASACLKVVEQGYVYATAWLLCLSLSVVAIGVAVFSIWQTLAPLRCWLALSLAASLAAYVGCHYWRGERLYESLGSGTFAQTLFLVIPRSYLDLSLDIANAVTGAGAAFIAVACLMSAVDLPIPKDSSTEEVSAWGESLRARLAILRRTITAGAVMLVAGVIDIGQYLAWPQPLLDPASQAGYKAITDGLLTVQGGEYSLIMLLVFVCPAAMMCLSVALTAKLESIQISIAQFLTEHGLNITLPRFLPEVISIAAPLIAAPVTSLLHLSPA